MELAELLKLLANPDRISIVEALSTHQEMSVNDVAAHVGIPATRASQHLNLLRAFRLVSRKSQGRRRFYSLSSTDLAHWLQLGNGLVATGDLSGK